VTVVEQLGVADLAQGLAEARQHTFEKPLPPVRWSPSASPRSTSR
jgi:hypothetical protein